ncbi:hypothetical protein [Nannocystis sp.]|uniref:hypothetical protein n=1 Tax=Nannocystis sp. TaxID=1962667 RepID=UPI0025EDAAA4|nr:hypothetical protein [Nannocystis sp.]MBK7828926.1 hypothetical protein [Nannocystis sp.]
MADDVDADEVAGAGKLAVRGRPMSGPFRRPTSSTWKSPAAVVVKVSSISAVPTRLPLTAGGVVAQDDACRARGR